MLAGAGRTFTLIDGQLYGEAPAAERTLFQSDCATLNEVGTQLGALLGMRELVRTALVENARTTVCCYTDARIDAIVVPARACVPLLVAIFARRRADDRGTGKSARAFRNAA